MSEQLSIAKAIGITAHKGQARRGGMPYYTHPEAVAKSVRHLGVDYEVVAWLHDVLEDANVTESDLEYCGISMFCVMQVDRLTKKPNIEYLDYIREIKRSNVARAVKIADIKHNLSDDPTAKQRGKYKLALEILESDAGL